MLVWDKLTEAEKFRAVFVKTVKRPGAVELLTALDALGFFVAPASTKYHGNYEGGLVEHSNNVFRRLVVLAAWEDEKAGRKKAAYSAETLAVVALLHDVCKARQYSRTEKDGVQQYAYNADDTALGHGEKSVYMIMRHMRLTWEEALAIRWHMGAYDAAARADLRDLDRAMEQSRLVLLLHLADMMATHFDDVRRN